MKPGLALVLLAVLLIAAAPDSGGGSRTGDQALLELATQLAKVHGEADGLAPREPARAAALLQEALGGLPSPEVLEGWELRADAWARCAELWLAAGQAPRALEAATKGLAEGPERRTIYTAQLWLRLGEVQEQQGADAAAVQAYLAAIEDAKAELAARRAGGR